MTAPLDLPAQARPADPAAERAQRLQALVEATVGGYYERDLGTDTLELSEQIDKLLRLPPALSLRTGQAWRERLHPDDGARVMRLLAASLRQRSGFTTQYRLRRVDGSYVEVEDRACVLTDETGEPAHLVGTLTDVAQERGAMQALRDAQELYETLFRKAANPALRVDRQGRIVDANRAALDLLGLDPGQFGVARLADHMTPEGAQEPRAASGEGGRRARLEVRVETPDGVRQLLVSTVPCRAGGQDCHFLLGTDVTELEAQRATLEAARAELEGKALALTHINAALRVDVEQSEADRRALEAARAELEEKAQALTDTNAALRVIDERRQADRRALEAALADLEEKAQALTDTNAALRVIVEQRAADRRALDERVAANMRELVLPILERLRCSLASHPGLAHVDALSDTLSHITQAFGPLDEGGLPAGADLTRRETLIASLVRAGKSTAEIAAALDLAPSTVSFHRRNIRRKLKLHGRNVRLADRLATARRTSAAVPPSPADA
jgi:PAS domain S-box-containing protein